MIGKRLRQGYIASRILLSMKNKAIVITGGFLDTNSAKTAHGLIRGTERFTIVGIVDEKHAGKDAGEVLDGKNRNLPVYASVSEAARIQKPDYCIVGVATKGGVIPDTLRTLLREALENNLSIVNGLHDHVSEHEDLAQLAKRKGLEIIDVRKAKKFKELHFWTGKIKEVKCPKIAVLGTDCAMGKRTTTRFLVEAMRNAGYKAEMIYTGQTGWMQGARYGFIFDSTLNDFISGELEHAVYTCYTEVKPDIIFIEGQSLCAIQADRPERSGSYLLMQMGLYCNITRHANSIKTWNIILPTLLSRKKKLN